MADLSGPNPDEINGVDARGVAITAKPVLVGARGSTATPATVTDGQAVDLWADVRGVLNVALRDSSGAAVTVTSSRLQVDIAANAPINVAQIGGATVPAAAAPSDAESNAQNMANDEAFAMGFNGTTWDRLRTIQALDAAPTVDLGVLAVGAGPGWDRKLNPGGVAATNTANAVTVVTDGADVMQFHVTTIGVTPGSMIFETTGDDGAWATAGYVIKLASGPDTRVEGAFVPAVNDVYMIRTTGIRQVRYRVNAVYASGTATVKVTASTGVVMIKSIDMPAPPHNFGYAETGVSAQYSTTQTSTILGPTVAASQRMVVTKMQIDASGTTAGDVQVYFGTGAFARGTSKPLFDGGFKPSTTLRPGVISNASVPWMGAADEEVRVTTSAAIANLTVTIWYYLVAA